MNNKQIRVCGLMLALWLAPAALCAELKLPAIFKDDMVLQRNQPAPVWGWADAGASVSVKFAGQQIAATADQHGRWMARLAPTEASAEPQVMTISSAEKELQIKNVLVGDVWLCSGQSNMAMTVDGKTGWLYIGGVANAKEEVENSANPLIRQFYVDWKVDTTPASDCTGRWTTAGPATTAEFSATGYFFARELQKQLKIPIAIVNASFGGSAVENWISKEALTAGADPAYVAEMNEKLDAYTNHEQRVARHLADLATWQEKNGRMDRTGMPADARAVLGEPADGSTWKSIELPATLAKLGVANGGIVWFRREIDVPEKWGTAWRITFPACRDFFAIYYNGSKIFEVTAATATPANEYRVSIPKGVIRTGKNTFAVRVQAHGGNGGITGRPTSFVLQPFSPQNSPIPMAGQWQCKVEKEFEPLAADAAEAPVLPLRPVLHWLQVPAHYNTMIHPLIPYAIKGAAWYQGESNVDNAARYPKHLRILINDWRQRWGQGDFPFYICQLPGYGARTNVPGDSPWAALRDAQFSALKLPNTGIANLIDTCEDGDLHPLTKQDAGHRLALVALANAYGTKDLPWSGPVFRSMKIQDGKAVVQFDHAGDGLVARKLPATVKANLRKPELGEKPLVLPSPGSEVQGFALCGADRKWVWADAKIEGSAVRVWSGQVPQPVAARYGWADHPVCNLYNQAGLPAFPFRTDDFPGTKVNKK